MNHQYQVTLHSVSIDVKYEKTSLEELINLLQTQLDTLKEDPEASSIIIDRFTDDDDYGEGEIRIIAYRSETEKEAKRRLDREKLIKASISKSRKEEMKRHLEAYEHLKKLVEKDNE